MNDTILLNKSEILSAYRLIFAPSAKADLNALGSIGLEDVKRAYRKMALDVHPDRFASYGEIYQKECTERFIELCNAYEILSRYLSLEEKRFMPDAKVHESAPWPRTYEGKRRNGSGPFRHSNGNSCGFSGQQRNLPRRYLRFGEFLYHSSLVSWKALVRALVWQSKQRPRIGEIAMRWHWLNESQTHIILGDRHPGERLGEALLRHQIISPFQLRVLINYQRRLQSPIGQYFVNEGFLREDEIKYLLELHRSHNLNFRGCRGGEHVSWHP